MKGKTIIRIIKDNPELTSEGIEWNLKNKNYKIQRKTLLDSELEIRKCIWWLQDFYKPNKSMKNLIGSYGLKHLVEKYYDDYVSNGSFVTAAKYLRLKAREFKDDPNIYLPFSKKKLKEYNKNILTLKNKLEEPNE
jgi:hypothetical protein